MEVVLPKVSSDPLTTGVTFFSVNQSSGSSHEIVAVVYSVWTTCLIFSKFTQRINTYIFSSSPVNIWTHA